MGISTTAYDPVETITNLISQLRSFTRNTDHMLDQDGHINSEEVQAVIRRLQSYAARLQRIITPT